MKVPFITADKFWENVTTIMSSLESEEKMLKQCRDFVTLLSVDAEFKIAAEGDDEAERAELRTPSGDEDNGAMGPPGSGRGRKRKAPSTPGGRKKRARSSSVSRRAKGKGSRKRASVESDDNDDDNSEGWE
jgi:cohesin loading factor subunit SCC2